MRDGDYFPLNVVLEAVTSVIGWVVVIVATIVVGFCCGYWIGHREVVGLAATLNAMLWVPIIWLGAPLIFIPYAVTALAIYLPTRFESLWLRLLAVTATFFAWLVVVAVIVEATSHGQFWHW